MKPDQHICYAALDVGTSQIKMAVYSPVLTPALQLIGHRPAPVHMTPPGKATCSYEALCTSVSSLFDDLSLFLREHAFDRVYLGICGLVSSYLIWDKQKQKPVCDEIPVWLDSTCSPSLNKLFSKLAGGKDIRLLGSPLPQGTNWLITKLYHHRTRKLSDNEIFLQLGDALFSELSGCYASHFSSQISIVHHHTREYSRQLLSMTGYEIHHFPELSSRVFPVRTNNKLLPRGFPCPAFAVPALADFYASFLGLSLSAGEGFMLANTSEISGKATSHAMISRPFITLKMEKFFLLYGSTNTGANVMNWFVRNMLRRPVSPETFNELNQQAQCLDPAETPLFYPFIDGERSPWWDSTLQGTFAGLRSEHTDAHLYRAVMESIAFCRRYQFETMPSRMPRVIKICGGSAQNQLFNQIRAAVLKRPLLKAVYPEIALTGVLSYVLDVVTSSPPLSPDYESVFPEKNLIKAYEKKYNLFLKHMNKALKLKI